MAYNSWMRGVCSPVPTVLRSVGYESGKVSRPYEGTVRVPVRLGADGQPAGEPANFSIPKRGCSSMTGATPTIATGPTARLATCRPRSCSSNRSCHRQWTNKRGPATMSRWEVERRFVHHMAGFARTLRRPDNGR